MANAGTGKPSTTAAAALDCAAAEELLDSLQQDAVGAGTLLVYGAITGNVQVDADDNVHLLDFDRGRLRDPGIWRQKNLARLHRSLRKIRGLDPAVAFTPADWNECVEAYFSASRSA